jgi:hypothetical protein
MPVSLPSPMTGGSGVARILRYPLNEFQRGIEQRQEMFKIQATMHRSRSMRAGLLPFSSNDRRSSSTAGMEFLRITALKQHFEAADRRVGASARSGFVELRPSRPTGDDGCVIEVEGLRTTVRIRLHRVGLPDLAQLSRAIAGIDA